jgi:hypothetical protein
MQKYSAQLRVMPKDDLALELERLQGHYMYFQAADRSYNDPREIKLRRANETQLRLVHAEIGRRKELGRLALAKLETTNSLKKLWATIRGYLCKIGLPINTAQ